MSGGPRTYRYTRPVRPRAYTRPAPRPYQKPQEDEEDRPTTYDPGPSRQPEDEEEDRPTTYYRAPGGQPRDDEDDRPTTYYRAPGGQPHQKPRDDEDDRPTTYYRAPGGRGSPPVLTEEEGNRVLDRFFQRFGTPSRQPNPPPREAAKSDILKRFFEITEGEGGIGTEWPVANLPAGWPKTIRSAHAFSDLGVAMTKMNGFPINGSELEKANFVYLHMDLVARTYGLSAGDGGLYSQAIVGLHRLCSYVPGLNDPEEAESLKGGDHLGNCAEWSQAFSEILSGAGVSNHVVYADKSCEPGKSARFNGTDTTVIVEERDWDGRRTRISRRVFDAFRAAYHSPDGMPTKETLAEWSNLPLTNADRWKGEKGPSWLSDMVDKPCVKDGPSETALEDPSGLLSPSTVNRPTRSEDNPGHHRPNPARSGNARPGR
jgi:hypothetical protein